MNPIYGLLAGIGLLLGASALSAQDLESVESENMAESAPVSTFWNRGNRLPLRLRGYASHSDETEEARNLWKDVEWNVSAIGVGQGNTDSTDTYRSQVDGSFTLDLEALVHVGEHGSAYGLIQAGNGAGLDDRVPNFSVFNGDAMADSDFQVSELWYQHEFMEERLRFRLGKVDLTTDFDCNEYANDENTQFLSGGFVNNLAVEFPPFAFGGMLWASLGERIDVGYGYAKNENTWTDLFDDGFHIGEIVFKLGGSSGKEDRAHLRFYGWCNTADHATFDATRENINNYGWGISYDHKLTERLGLFARFGAQRECVSEIGQSASVGFQVLEPLYGRTDDVLGFAWGTCLLSDDYRNSCDFRTSPEHHVECYYNWRCHELLTVSPNLQYVWNPCGDRSAEDVCVLGLRVVLSI